MNNTQLIYLVFSGVILLAVLLDLGLLSKKNAVVTLKQALLQNFFVGRIILCFLHFHFL
jgi:tellurite resistance protein TerC